MTSTGAYPPGCTQRHVDEASRGYWDDEYDDSYLPDDEYDDEPDWEHYDPVAEAAWDRECRRQMWLDRWHRVVRLVCFWRRWRKRPDIDDEIPF